MKTQHLNQISLLLILIMFNIPVVSYADVLPVSERTPQVRDAIVAAVGVSSATDVTERHLAPITSLDLRAKSITGLKSGDFSGMTGLTSLNLYGNQLSSLPNGIFEGLTSLTTLRLGGNTVDPMPISVSLEKVRGSDSDGQFKAVAPTGAPFAIVLPINVMNGSIADSVTSLAISKGSTESSAITVSRTADTTDAVTANIGTLPSLPNNHYGYTLSKPDTLPLEVIGEEAITTPIVPDPIQPPMEPPAIDAVAAPVFTDGTVAIRSVTENTDADVNIGTPIAATDADDDTLTYSLSGTDASSFSIDNTSGLLRTKAMLDYETKRVYTVIVSVSDGNLTDAITVIISVIDVAETALVSTRLAVSDRTPAVRDAIVASVEGIDSADAITAAHLSSITSLNLRSAGISELKSGDFSGLTALTNLNLYGNMLTSLPSGIFEGLTSLTTLRLGGNLVDPMPLPVSLQQVSDSEFQAIIRTGAPFDVVLPVNVTISGGTTLVTIPKGSVTSSSFTDVGTPSIGALPVLPANHFGYTFAKSTACNRTSQVRDAIAQSVLGVNNCSDITDIDLARITVLTLENMSITSLKSDDFSGLLSLTMLSVNNNELTSLPNGIFEDLTALTAMHLGGNAVDPLPLTISLQKIGENQIKAIVPSGVPFTIMLPVIIRTGGVTTSSDTLTIPQGKSESELQTITRPVGTIAAVTVDIGNPLPNLPSLHSGYEFVKSNQQPLEILKRIDVAPVFTDGESTTRTVAENTATDTNIGTAIAATDANNDTLTYSLSGTDAASFDIDSTTGQLKTKASLDYETKNVYTVTITVSDGGLLIATITVTINVTDVDENRAPVFTEGANTTRTIAERTAVGTNIGKPVSATDADNDTLTYTLSGTDASVFAIDTKSGQLKTTASLDFETRNSYSVTITVSDGTLTDSINVTIGVTDIDEKPATDGGVTTREPDTTPTNNAPEFTAGDSTPRSVAENTGSGVDIGSAVGATDADDDTLTYSLGGTHSASFSIDSTNGQLRTSDALDYETETSYSVTITVSDGKGGSDSISITINVIDVDEAPANNAPVFTDGTSTARSVAENTVSGVDIGGAVSATDADDDTLTYSLGGTDAASFSIDTTTGQVKTSTTLDYETKSNYSVIVIVSDGTLTDSIGVTIDVSNVNEAPVFSDGDSTTRSIAENVPADINIGSAVSATDPEGDKLTYTVDGTNAASFSIDAATGQLKTKASLDYETEPSYSVTITVFDGTLTDSITVAINVTNLDETPSNNPPVFTDGTSTTRSIAENTAADSNIGTPIAATDVDKNTLAYLLSGTDTAAFSVDINTGQLKRVQCLTLKLKILIRSPSPYQMGAAQIASPSRLTSRM